MRMGCGMRHYKEAGVDILEAVKEDEFFTACRQAEFGKCLLKKLRQNEEFIEVPGYAGRFRLTSQIMRFAQDAMQDPRRTDLLALLGRLPKHRLRLKKPKVQTEPADGRQAYYGNHQAEHDYELIPPGEEFVHDLRGT